MFRVLCNDTLRHQQWIVVRDHAAGYGVGPPAAPVMVAGPFIVERDALMHCAALNRQHATVPIKSRSKVFRWVLDPALAIRLAALGWIGCCSFVFCPPNNEVH